MSQMTPEQIHALHAKIGANLNEIAACFVPDAKITLLVRFPANPDADMVMTQDELGLAIESLERQKSKMGIPPANEPVFEQTPH